MVPQASFEKLANDGDGSQQQQQQQQQQQRKPQQQQRRLQQNTRKLGDARGRSGAAAAATAAAAGALPCSKPLLMVQLELSRSGVSLSPQKCGVFNNNILLLMTINTL